jgi:hypothetical protein
MAGTAFSFFRKLKGFGTITHDGVGLYCITPTLESGVVPFSDLLILTSGDVSLPAGAGGDAGVFVRVAGICNHGMGWQVETRGINNERRDDISFNALVP